MPTVERLKELFDYCPITGNMIRKITVAGNAVKGTIAGRFSDTGYRTIDVNYKRYKAHHIVWLWHGNEAVEMLDHINRDPLDNRIENLRPANLCQNGWNAKISKRNTSGIKGVYWNKATSSWRVRIMANRKTIEGGLFKDFELAELVINELRDKYHGEFANTY